MEDGIIDINGKERMCPNCLAIQYLYSSCTVDTVFVSFIQYNVMWCYFGEVDSHTVKMGCYISTMMCQYWDNC